LRVTKADAGEFPEPPPDERKRQCSE